MDSGGWVDIRVSPSRVYPPLIETGVQSVAVQIHRSIYRSIYRYPPYRLKQTLPLPKNFFRFWIRIRICRH
jgi:hypothetical protein